jgi:DNA-binding Lrp family transcriptional regulator
MGSIANRDFRMVNASKVITIYAKNVLWTLKDYENVATGQCNPKIAAIAQALNLSPSTAARALAELREIGIIKVRRTRSSCRYEIAPVERWKELLQICPIDMADMSNRHISTLLVNVTNERYEAAARKASSTVANRTPKTAAAAKTNAKTPNQRKPQKRAMSRADFSAYDAWTVEEYRVMLRWHAPHLHLPPTDDAIVKQVLDATGGAHPNEAHKVLLELHKRHRFETIQSWGLVPVVLGDWFKRKLV